MRLINELNDRNKSHKKFGRFLLLHRHRIFNARQGVWMGWERKRGKLLDLNNLLARRFRRFPVKAGDTASCARCTTSSRSIPIRNCRAAPRTRLVGAMTHPLNRAVIDPGRRIVTDGYGILQPRVGVSVHSASQSRMANIYSGQTGFDIYTRAISDVYQDLYGEGSFTGKGIYEVATLQDGAGEALPPQCSAEPRSHRRRLRARWPRYRHRSHRRLPLSLQRLHAPQTPLGARRLADRAVALHTGAGRVGPVRAQPHLDHLALEDPRQPPAFPGGASHA